MLKLQFNPVNSSNQNFASCEKLFHSRKYKKVLLIYTVVYFKLCFKYMYYQNILYIVDILNQKLQWKIKSFSKYWIVQIKELKKFFFGVLEIDVYFPC